MTDMEIIEIEIVDLEEEQYASYSASHITQ